MYTCRVTVVLALASEAFAGAASLEHVVVGVGGQLVEVALCHVAVARVAHHVCANTRTPLQRLRHREHAAVSVLSGHKAIPMTTANNFP